MADNPLAHCDKCALDPDSLKHIATVRWFADSTGLVYGDAFYHVQRVLSHYCMQRLRLRRHPQLVRDG